MCEVIILKNIRTQGSNLNNINSMKNFNCWLKMLLNYFPHGFNQKLPFFTNLHVSILYAKKGKVMLG